MNIKQLFCTHIWKLVDTEFLYTQTKTTNAFDTAIYKEVKKVSALHLKCIKCNKKKITIQYETTERGYV